MNKVHAGYEIPVCVCVWVSACVYVYDNTGIPRSSLRHTWGSFINGDVMVPPRD